MALEAQIIHDLIKAALPDAEIQIEDLRGDGDHYAAYVTSTAFEGKSRIEQHKMIYAALGDKMGKELHALAIQTKTPDQD